MIEFDDFRVLYTPRTGSRALDKFLRTQGGVVTDPHHTPIDAIPKDDKPNYVVARHPVGQMESWYWGFNNRPNCTMADFIRGHTNKGNFRPMNMYMSIIDFKRDKVFIYEDGLENIVADMGFGINPIEVIGASEKKYTWPLSVRQLLYERFTEDYEFYYKALEKSCG